MSIPFRHRIGTGLLLAFALAGNALAAMSLAEVTQRFEAQGNRVLSAERKQHQGQRLYRFKLLTPKGRVRKVWVDPGTGQRLR